MLITEKILGDIGGWQSMKTARLLVAGGAVEEAGRVGDVFRGLVGEGRRKFAVTLTVEGPTKAGCRCSCPEAQRGLICAHAIAVALASLQPAASGTRPVTTAPVKAALTPAPDKPIPRGRFDVFIPAPRLDVLAARGGQLPVFLQFQPGGEEIDPVTRWLAGQGLPLRNGPLSLDAAELGGFLKALTGHPRVWEGSPGTMARKAITIRDATGELSLRATLESADQVTFQFKSADMMDEQDEAASGAPGIIDLNGELCLWQRGPLALTPLAGTPPECAKLLRECLQADTAKARRDLRWLVRNLDDLGEAVSLEADEALSHLRRIPAEAKFVIELDGSPRQVTARIGAVVGPVRHALPLSSTESDAIYPVAAKDGTLTFYLRNTAREDRMAGELRSAGFAAATDNSWTLRGEREVAEFFAATLPGWQRRHDTEFTERWRAAFRGWQRVAPVVRRTTGAEPSPQQTSRGWLDMEFSYEAADGFRVPRQEIMRLIRSGQSAVRGRQGQTYVLDAESCDEFETLLAESGARLGEGGRVAMTAESGHMLNEFLATGQPVAKLVLPDPEEVRRRLGDLAPRLRDYQLEGVRWLIGATDAGRGALLADDMGLGKTLQVIALLRWLANCEQLKGKTALVVCPTSLIYNWKSELEKFAPNLYVNIIHGSERVLARKNDNAINVNITSYSLLVNDLNYHLTKNHHVVVLDEASYIRNPATKVAQAVFSLQVPVRVALTGTPVENSIQDLWSLMRFVQPGFLGSQKDFQECYAKPLTSAGTNPEAAAKLTRRLRARLGPFVLRRTKKEVVRELPDKIEQVIFCDLSPQQKEVYRRLLEEGRAEIQDARRRSAGAGRMTMFTVLLRLRQVCNDLRLLGLKSSDGVPQSISEKNAAGTESASGKWEPLADIVHDALGGAHKILIFSQFTGMLRLLRDWLDARSIGHSYLDGSTRNRAGEVAAFQTDPARPVFLISLKAGGYGLNLTAADHVILVEPWWNPAVEAQAIDRAHRIGQASVVTASRLIARGTVEERILKLQATKRQLMASAVEDDPLTLPGLTDDDLESLLE